MSLICPYNDLFLAGLTPQQPHVSKAQPNRTINRSDIKVRSHSSQMQGTDRMTDRQVTDRPTYEYAWSHLKLTL